MQNVDKIIRNRKQRKILRNSVFGFKAIIVLSIAIFIGWLALLDGHNKTSKFISDNYYNLTAKAGFKIEKLNIEGLNNLKAQELAYQILEDIYPEADILTLENKSILKARPSKVMDSLNSIGWVQDAQVSRSLPDTLSIKIVERQPFAIFNNENGQFLIDKKANKITRNVDSRYRKLPFIYAKEDKLKTLIDSVFQHKELSHYISEIRLNKDSFRIITKQDAKIELNPEQINESILRLVKLQSRKQVLDREISNLDLRVANKIYLSLIE